MAKITGYEYLTSDAVARVKNLRLMARGVVEGFITGLHRSPYKGFSVEFAEHREYSPGDNLRHLDWQAMARTDRYYIKQYEEETNLRAMILLDTSGSMGYGGDSLTKLQYGCFLAGTLSYLMMKQQDSVGMIFFDDRIRKRIPAKSTPVHLNMMLRELEQVRSGNDTNVAQVFHDLAETLKKRSLLIVISDLYADLADVAPALRHFRQKKHEVIVFHVFDQTELEFPFDKLTDFVDLETNQRLQVDPRFVRDEYMAQIEEFCESYRRECAESHIEYVRTDTSVPFDVMLTRFLAKRSRLG
jgi:uncharacterized protein (DUF58 family)